ncbi:hypothetical protein [Saccharopolyspora sp. 5N708]|uniref:hypothetical protein n=1 Tax=Saccharopolyspora sp. 5N708 TaxID=3457424 RepID=UPI003FD0B3B6
MFASMSSWSASEMRPGPGSFGPGRISQTTRIPAVPSCERNRYQVVAIFKLDPANVAEEVRRGEPTTAHRIERRRRTPSRSQSVDSLDMSNEST